MTRDASTQPVAMSQNMDYHGLKMNTTEYLGILPERYLSLD